MSPLIPIKENEHKGFHYTVSDDQIAAHQKRTVIEVFEWLEKTSMFVFSLQTPEERKQSIINKNLD